METYWTRSSRAVASEKSLKVGGTVLIVAAITFLMAADTTPAETGWKGFALMGTLIPVILWWDLASLRTRIESRFRSEVLVPAIFLVMSAAPIFWSVFQVLSGHSGNFLGAMGESLALLLVTVPLALASLFFVRWTAGMRRGARAEHAERAGEIAQEHVPTPRRPERQKVAAQAVRSVRAARGLLDARPSSSYRRLEGGERGTNCLYCFAPIPQFVAAGSRCEACGRTTRKIDQAIYWSRSERHVQIERRAKALGLFLAASAMVLVILNAASLSQAFHWGGPYSALLVLVLLAVWWDLCGMITRYRSILRLELLLPPVVASLGFAGAYQFRIIQEGRPDPALRDFWGEKIVPAVDGPAWSWSLVGLAAGVVVWLVMRWVLDWRERIIQLRQGRYSG